MPSASLSLTRPAFVCVFCIPHASPTRPSTTPLHLYRPPPPHAPPVATLLPAPQPSTSATPHTPCHACSTTSSSTTTRTSAARSASRSSTCPTETSARVPAAIKYAHVHARAVVKPPAVAHADDLPDMSVLLQQHQDNHERTVSCLSPSLRRLDHRVQEHHSRRVGPPRPSPHTHP